MSAFHVCCNGVMSSGIIYGIRLFNSPDVRYVGLTTTSIEQRFKSHQKAAAGAVRKYPLYDWMRKHNKGSFEIFVIETVEDDLEDKERYWIKEYKRNGHKLLNLTEGGQGPNGHVWTEEQRSRHSKKMKEVVNRPEVKEKIKKNRVIFYGEKHSDEQKRKWSEERKGSITGVKNPNYGKFGPSHPSYGRKLSEEAKQKLSKERLGEKNPNYGKSASEETRKKLSLAQKGKPKPKSARSAHVRYHVNLKGFSERCNYCTEENND